MCFWEGASDAVVEPMQFWSRFRSIAAAVCKRWAADLACMFGHAQRMHSTSKAGTASAMHETISAKLFASRSCRCPVAVGWPSGGGQSDDEAK